MALKLWDACGDAEELGEVAACGAAHGADAGGVHVILGGMGAQPADGGFAIVDGGWKGIGGGEAIGDGDGDVAVLGEGEEEFVITFAFACAEAATVDADDGGVGACSVFGLGEVDLEVLVVWIGELDVTSEADVVRDDEIGPVSGGDEEQGEDEMTHGGERKRSFSVCLCKGAAFSSASLSGGVLAVITFWPLYYAEGKLGRR